MRKILILANKILLVANIAIGTGLGIFFLFSSIAKLIFQNKENQTLFLILTSIFLSAGVLIYSYFFKKSILQKREGAQEKIAKDVTCKWEVFGKWFFGSVAVTTITLAIIFLKMFLDKIALL